MHNALISVIVPIYNTEKYLPRCIESISGQTYGNLEIILVDDGSADGSGDVCRAYARTDSRIIVIHQENRGNIAARKTGLKAASGEYIMFVDSDDWIDSRLVQVLYEQVQMYQVDMVVSDVKIFFIDGKEEDRRSFIAPGVYENSKEAVKDLFYCETCTGIAPYMVAKLFQRELILDAVSGIEDRIQYAEDIAVTWTCLMKGIKISFIADTRYYYCRRPESLVESQDDFFLAKINYLYLYLRRLFEDEGVELQHQLDSFIVAHVKMAVNEKLGLSQKNLMRKNYQFDFSRFFPSPKRIVLYGAGTVGQDCYELLKRNKNITLCAWIDKNDEKCREKNPEVQPVAVLRQLEYDYIFVAVLHQEVFDDILKTLEEYSVCREKILWGKPLDI